MINIPTTEEQSCSQSLGVNTVLSTDLAGPPDSFNPEDWTQEKTQDY